MPPMPHQLPDLDWTVNETIRCCPATARVFNDSGVDSCCGGGATLDAAARDAGVEAGVLLEAIHRVVAGDNDTVGLA